MKRTIIFWVSLLSLVGSQLLMKASIPPGVRRQSVTVPVGKGPPLKATLWLPAELSQDEADIKGAVLVCHGVTASRGVMATLCKALAGDGYIALTFDFWGHGQSAVRFQWAQNETQVRHAWIWLQTWMSERSVRGNENPMIFLGHSMGAFSGGPALQQDANASAFVAMGALPSAVPPCPLLVSMGRFEELFDEDKARTWQDGRARVLVSPFSDHAGEPYDPFLVSQTVRWIDEVLGRETAVSMSIMAFPWLGACLGAVGSLGLVFFLGALVALPSPWVPSERETWWNRSLLYPLLSNILRLKGSHWSSAFSSKWSVLFKGLLCGAAFCLLLALVFHVHLWSCHPLHGKRIAQWLFFLPFLSLWSLWSAARMEQVGIPSAGCRFLMACLGRVLPLLAVAVLASLTLSPFLGMMLGLLAACCVLGSLLYTTVAQGTRDPRIGAVTLAVFLSWLLAWFFPLCW